MEQEGQLTNDDVFELLSRDKEAITIAEMNRLFAAEKYDRKLLSKAMNTAALPEDWREYFSQRLAQSIHG